MEVMGQRKERAKGRRFRENEYRCRRGTNGRGVRMEE